MSIADRRRRCRRTSSQGRKSGAEPGSGGGRTRSRLPFQHEEAYAGRRHDGVRQFALPFKINFDDRIVIRDSSGLDLAYVNGVGVLIGSNTLKSGRRKDAEHPPKPSRAQSVSATAILSRTVPRKRVRAGAVGWTARFPGSIASSIRPIAASLVLESAVKS